MPVHVIAELLNGAVSPFFLSSASICVPGLTASLGLSLTGSFLECWGLVQGAKGRKQFVFGGQDKFSSHNGFRQVLEQSDEQERYERTSA